MDDERRIEAVKGIISSLFASQRALRTLGPEYGGGDWGICSATLASSSHRPTMDW
jgi:hypothetical protein